MPQIQTDFPLVLTEPETILLTPNTTIADALLRRTMQQNHSYSMRVETVFTLTEWLHQQLVVEQRVAAATENQLRVLWEEVIAGMELPFDLHPPTLAPLALQAWRYLRQWRVPMTELAQAEYSQNLQFNHWCQRFESHLVRLNLQTLEHLAERRLEAPEPKPFRKIILVGFIEPPPPLWHDLIEHLGLKVETLELDAPTGSSEQYSATSPEDEILAATRWAQQCMLANPTARIGLISTHGRELLDRLERQFWKIGIAGSSRKPLSYSGLITAAMNLLKINLPSLDLAHARAIIQSPFIGDYPADLFNRSVWEERICALETRLVSRSDLLYCTREFESLTTVLQSLRRQPLNQSTLQWAELFQQQLRQIGWPGTRALNPEQAHAMREWTEILGDLATLGPLCSDVNADRALQLLQQLIQARTYATGTHSQVHLLDRVEAAFDFDHLWLFGVDDEHWPSSPAPQPLLPLNIQNRYNLPHCSAEHELTLCEKLLTSITQRGRQIIFSFVQLDGDHERRLTPVLQDLPSVNLPPPDQPHPVPGEFEWVDCRNAPAIRYDQVQVSGGSHLLQLMASSPFDAFATYRLNARALAKPFEGISPMQMGLLIHDLLDRVWTQLGNSTSLRKLSSAQLDQLIASQVEATLQQWKGAWRFGSRQLGLTARNLKHLLQQWLLLELERGDFNVLHTERQIEIQLGGIRLRLRLDRIDQVNGGLLLIDYKSGSSGRVEDWRSAPPTEPQLPLYVIAQTDPVVGIAFARVKSGEIKWVSMGSEANLGNMTVADDWLELEKNWRAQLTQLAEEFARGDARVRETESNFFRDDPLKSLHRFNEFDELEKCKLQN